MSQDALNQYVALVYRLDAVGPRPRDVDVYLEGAASLDGEEAWVGVRQLQHWLASFPPEPSAEFLTKLVELAVNYRVPNPPTLKDVYKSLPEDVRGRGLGSITGMRAMTTMGTIDDDDDDLEGGAGFDCAGWLDKAPDDLLRDEGNETMELFLFKTAALVLNNLKDLGGLQLVQPGAVSFFFTSIEYGSTLPVQRMASYCAGVLSHQHLPVLLDAYFERQKTVPEKQFRWLLYQQATQFFGFGVGLQQQAEATVSYLEATAKKITKIDRGKLRGAICTSLYRIFGSIMGQIDGEAQVYWQAFTSRFAMLAKNYSEAYTSIYATVAKWAKKAKHALPCWKLMVRMECVGPSAFYIDKKRDKILPILLGGAKKYRAECLAYAVEYLAALPVQLAQCDMDGFLSEAKKLLALCFPKRKDPEPGESWQLVSIVTSIGRLNAHFAFAELQTMIPSKDTTTTQKSLLCHALGSLAKDHQREVISYNGTLGPLMLTYMEADHYDLAVNAIRSFPYVTVPDPQHEKLIVEKVVAVAVNAGVCEVADTAFASITAYLMQMPDMMLGPLVLIFLSALSSRSFSRGERDDYDAVLCGFRFLHRLLLLYLGNLEKSGKPCALNATGWIQVREHAESVTIMWLVHSDPGVRSAVLEVLRTFTSPVFVALEDTRHRGPEPIVRLAALLPPAEDSASGQWCTHLVKVLAHRPPLPPRPVERDEFGRTIKPEVERDPRKMILSEKFRAHLEYAWVRLVQRFRGALEILPELNAEKVRLWLNYTRFLCVSMTWPHESMGGFQQQYAKTNKRTSPCAALSTADYSRPHPPQTRSFVRARVAAISGGVLG